jgi:hypothetical protein
MNCPTKEQIKKAANTSAETHKAIELLFPEVFERDIKPGDIYEWGADSNGAFGLVVDHHLKSCYSFVNPLSGKMIVRDLEQHMTKSDLVNVLNSIPQNRLLDCYSGKLRGPFKLLSCKRR